MSAELPELELALVPPVPLELACCVVLLVEPPLPAPEEELVA
jgi:hypothetical protein